MKTDGAVHPFRWMDVVLRHYEWFRTPYILGGTISINFNGRISNHICSNKKTKQIRFCLMVLERNKWRFGLTSDFTIRDRVLLFVCASDLRSHSLSQMYIAKKNKFIDERNLDQLFTCILRYYEKIQKTKQDTNLHVWMYMFVKW